MRKTQWVLLFLFLSPYSLKSQIDSSLYKAILQNDLPAIETAIKKGVDINATDEHNANALMWSVYKADINTVKYLIKKGAVIPQKGTILLKRGSYGNLTGIAAGEGKLDVLKYLIEELKLPVDGKEYNAKKDTLDGWTALQWGAAKNHIEVVDYLIEQKADTILAAHKLSKLYQKQKKYTKSIAILKAAQKQVLKEQGKLNSINGELLNSLGEVYFFKGDLLVAKSLFKESNNIMEKVLGKEHPSYATTLNNLSVLVFRLGEYETAKSLFEEAIRIRAKTLGKEHPHYTASLNNLGLLFLYMGDYRAAESLLKTAISIEEKTLGKENPSYATTLDNLASLNYRLGKFEIAESLFREAIEIREKTLGREDPSYAASIDNLGVVISSFGRYERADSLYKEALKIREEVLGKEHPVYINSLNNIAESNERLGKYEAAESLYKEAILLREKLFGKQNPDYVLSLHNLAFFYFNTEKYKAADSLFREVNLIREEVLGKEHPDYAISLSGLAASSQAMGKYEESESYFAGVFTTKKKIVEQNFSFLSESEKEKYLQRNFESNRKQIHSCIFNNSSVYFQDLQYNLALFSKGIQLNTSKITQSFIFQQADSIALDSYYELLGLQRRLIKEYEKPIAKRIAVTELETQKEDLEKQLARASSFYRQEQTASKINYQDIQRKLKAGEAAIEFVHFNYQNPKPTDSILYAAAVLLPDATHVQYIPLFEEKQLTEQLATVSSDKGNLINQAYASRGIRGLTPKSKKINFQKVYHLVWKPLDSLLAGVTTIYYSPSGLLHRLNMNALPIGKKKILADKYELVQLTSTRSIALEVEERKDDLTAYVVGGVQYDITTSLLPEKIEIDTTAISLAAKEDYFSYTARSLRGERWDFLPGSLKEGRDITVVTQNVGYTVSYKTGKEATEEDFKTLGTTTKSPAIIHLATHGFFFPDVKDSLRNHSKEPIFKISEHPMLRSGLLLAGANGVWEGAISLADEEDGILTAMEISQMNLSNTEIVVLSACETGLGDIQGSEGVYGLQRAFKKAGVQYLIMSLWQVPDKETAEFMTVFYKNWLENKKSIPEAFSQTQKEMRQKYKKPHQWAGFVLVE